MHSSAHEQRTAVAYHEAGHLAIACHYGLPVRAVTVDPAGGDAPHAHAPFPVTAAATPAAISFDTLNLITSVLAGGIAEERYTDQLNVDVAEQDYEYAWRLAIEVADTERAAEALMNWLIIRAEQDVTRLWNEVTAIAAILIEKGTVTPEQARDLGRDADRRRTPRPDASS
jgi:hypothetical protein